MKQITLYLEGGPLDNHLVEGEELDDGSPPEFILTKMGRYCPAGMFAQCDDDPAAVYPVYRWREVAP